MKSCCSFREHHVSCPGHKRQRHTFTIYIYIQVSHETSAKLTCLLIGFFVRKIWQNFGREATVFAFNVMFNARCVIYERGRLRLVATCVTCPGEERIPYKEAACPVGRAGSSLMFMSVCQERIRTLTTVPRGHRRAALGVACPEICRSIEEPSVKVVALDYVISRNFWSQNKMCFHSRYCSTVQRQPSVSSCRIASCSTCTRRQWLGTEDPDVTFAIPAFEVFSLEGDLANSLVSCCRPFAIACSWLINALSYVILWRILLCGRCWYVLLILCFGGDDSETDADFRHSPPALSSRRMHTRNKRSSTLFCERGLGK